MELRDMRVLLAEDNPFNVMVAQDELQDAIPGVRIVLAANGREALDRVKKERFDLVLMDVQMPEMNGYEATRAIRALSGKKGSVPVLAMTANVMQAEVERCLDAGMNGYVPKPFRREELTAAIRQALTQASITGP